MSEADNRGSGPSPMLVRAGQVMGWAGVTIGIGFAIISAISFLDCFGQYRCDVDDNSFVAGMLLLLAGLAAWAIGSAVRYIIDGTKPWPLTVGDPPDNPQ